MSCEGKLGFALNGGGARAAYQVGVLRFLGRLYPDLRVPILTGVSAGAINTAHLASRTCSYGESVEQLAELWRGLKVEDVFQVHSRPVMKGLAQWALRLFSGGHLRAPKARGLADTAPLRSFILKALPHTDEVLVNVTRNIESGVLDAVGITTTNYGTAQSNTWIQGRARTMWQRAHRVAVECRLTVDHIMASSALPLFFPAIKVGEEWHGDGGIRLTAPLSPALHLGADRIVAISTRYPRTTAEGSMTTLEGYPPPAHIAGVLMNSVFLDMLEYDAQNLERINRLLESCPQEARGRLHPVRLLVVRPSQDLGRLAGDYEVQLPRLFRFMMRGLGTKETRNSDYLSMLMFQGDYVSRLIELGEQDAKARADEIRAFVES